MWWEAEPNVPFLSLFDSFFFSVLSTLFDDDVSSSFGESRRKIKRESFRSVARWFPAAIIPKMASLHFHSSISICIFPLSIAVKSRKGKGKISGRSLCFWLLWSPLSPKEEKASTVWAMSTKRIMHVTYLHSFIPSRSFSMWHVNKDSTDLWKESAIFVQFLDH